MYESTGVDELYQKITKYKNNYKFLKKQKNGCIVPVFVLLELYFEVSWDG